MSTKNKIALVTGGSRGLGKEMVLRLAAKQCDVIFTYQSNKDEAEKVVRLVESMGQKAKCFPLDVRNINEFDSFVENTLHYLKTENNEVQFDFLINNAGTGINQVIAETTEKQLDEMYNVHVKGVFFLTQKLLPHLRDGGRIINISSGLTRFSFPGSAAYACMKGAVEVFTRYLAKEMGSRKITANTIAPGAIATDFGGGSNRDNEDKRKLISSITALGRVGEASDIGGVVTFLCSPESEWINGQRIEVSGGMLV